MADDTPRIDALVSEVGVVRGKVDGVQASVVEIRDGISELRAAVAAIARVEANSTIVANNIALFAAKQVQHELLCDVIDTRLAEVERTLPLLVETRAWAVRGILGTLSLVAIALMGTILVK